MPSTPISHSGIIAFVVAELLLVFAAALTCILTSAYSLHKLRAENDENVPRLQPGPDAVVHPRDSGAAYHAIGSARDAPSPRLARHRSLRSVARSRTSSSSPSAASSSSGSSARYTDARDASPHAKGATDRAPAGQGALPRHGSHPSLTSAGSIEDESGYETAGAASLTDASAPPLEGEGAASQPRPPSRASSTMSAPEYDRGPGHASSSPEEGGPRASWALPFW